MNELTLGKHIKYRVFGRVAFALALVILVGVDSRVYGRHLPRLISKDLGDVLWPVMFYLIIVLVFPAASRWIAALGAFVIVAGIEFLKLHHVPWIQSIRSTAAGGFLLGVNFQWPNFIAYALGAMVGVLIDPMLRSNVVMNEPRTQ